MPISETCDERIIKGEAFCSYPEVFDIISQWLLDAMATSSLYMGIKGTDTN